MLTGVVASAAAQRRFGVRWTLVAAFSGSSLGMLLLARLPTDADYLPDVMPGLVLAAVGSGLGYPAVTGAAMSGTTEHDAGAAAAVLTSMQQLGSVLGLAGLVSIVGHRTAALATAGAGADVARTGGLTAAVTVTALVLAPGRCCAHPPAATGSGPQQQPVLEEPAS